MRLKDDESLEKADKKLYQNRNWVQLFKYAVVYIWPKSKPLLIRTYISLVILISIRALKLIVPIMYKYVIDMLTEISVGTDTTSDFLDVKDLFIC